jgi:virginiamycin A acetyltransferase
MNGPDPRNPHPMEGFPQIVFLNAVCRNPNIIIGDYTYYDAAEGYEDFEKNVLYLFPHIDDRLVIGKFCAIARGVTFIMNGANHKMSGLSTYPFQIFGNGWERVTPPNRELPLKGDTIIGNDVWLGYKALVMPGVRVGDGAIVASESVVTASVPPYAIVGGNPAKVLRMRYEPEVVARLCTIAWWHWPAEKITRHLEAIVGADVEALAGAGD